MMKTQQIDIDEIELFISSRKPIYRYNLSYNELESGKKYYNNSLNKNGPVCEIFGVDNNGYTNYLLYKSHSGNIHVLNIFMYTPKSHSIVTNEKWFQNRSINI